MIRDEVIEEADLIRYSGEIPEVAYWNSIYYLTEEADGPGLSLSASEERLLKKAVVERYLTIIARDLNVENIGQSLYRGVTRAATNWRRLKNFVRKEGFSLEAVRLQVLERLRLFLIEVSEKALRIDVREAELRSFVEELFFPPKVLLFGLRILYRED
ncbi:MAG: hypothetical protein GXO17_06550 [Thermodesulfobacteria bacterium]|nr:hypothetical protein [Thermodesulfobacteriota bacterium]